MALSTLHSNCDLTFTLYCDLNDLVDMYFFIDIFLLSFTCLTLDENIVNVIFVSGTYFL